MSKKVEGVGVVYAPSPPAEQQTSSSRPLFANARAGWHSIPWSRFRKVVVHEDFDGDYIGPPMDRNVE